MHEGKDREVPGPPPADFLTVVTFAVLGEDSDYYVEEDAHRKMDSFRCYVYDKFGPGIFHFVQARGAGGCTFQQDHVPVVKALVEIFNETDSEGSDSDRASKPLASSTKFFPG